MELLAEDLRGLLDYLGLEQVVLGGLSMGGYVAFAFYRQHPARVRALILADTRAEADSMEGKKGREDMAQLALSQGAVAVADKLLPRLLAARTLETKPEVVEKARRMMVTTPVTGIVGALRGMAARPDSTPTLAHISCPTLILVGEQDVLTPPADAQRMREQIRGSRLAVLPEAGHLSCLEQPGLFSGALGEFLAGL
jgi:pimeloyl-ACP methyl ester carboxylesterase